MEFDRKDISMNKLVATSLEGKFHVFDMRTQHPTKGFASVSEKVIYPGGESQMAVWPLRTEKVSKGYFFQHFGLQTEGEGVHVLLTVFTAGSVWACVCLTCFVAVWSLAKNDIGPVRREKCDFFTRPVGKC